MVATRRLSSQALVLLLLHILGVFVNTASADIVYQDQVCVITVVDIVIIYAWEGVGYGNYYAMLCTNPNALITFYAALDKYCTPHEQKSGMKVAQKYCLENAETSLTPRSALAANLTPEAVALLPVVTYGQLNETENQTAPFMPDQAFYDIEYATENAWDYAYRTDYIYSWALYGFWGALLVIGMIQKLTRVIMDKRRGYVYSDAEGQVRAAPTPAIFKPFIVIMAAFRKYLLTPSALPPYHQKRFLGCTVPNRWDTFIVASYWAISIILGAVNIHSIEGNLYWDYSSTQIWRYMSDRTGIMSYGNLPLMWMFAGRNNIFLWLTGWSFGSFNVYHRHIARIATLQAIMHSIGYTCYYYSEDAGSSYREDFAEWWWTAGVVATILMSFIVLFSFSYFRSKTYEFFLLLHIVFAVLTLVFLWYHTKIFSLVDYNNPYLLPPIVIWGFDRFLRIVRQLYCNLHVSRNRGKGLLRTKTTVTYDEASNILVMDVIPGNSHLFPGPGQHYYIYQPYRFFGWENHPFTLSYYNQEKDGDLHLQFWIRPYDGWTQKLARECIKKGGDTKTIAPSMFIEGPYGHAEPIHTFDNVLLVAGGSGIAGVLPYLLDYVRRTDKDARGPDGARIPTRTRKITLVWTDRSETYIRYIVDGVLSNLLSRHDIDLQFHLTGSTVSGAGTSSSHNVSTATSSTEHVHAAQPVAESPVSPVSSGSPGCEKSSSDLDHGHDQNKGVLAGDDTHSPIKKKETRRFYIHNGRPDVPEIVNKMATAIQGTEQRLAVMVCGSASLSDNVRHVVASWMAPNRDSIEYFEEIFGW